MFDPVFFFRSVQRCGGEVTPAELGGKRVPKHQIELARAPAILITPLQNFLVGPALEHALGYDCVVQPEELAARAVSRVPLAEVLVIIGRQLVFSMEPDFVEHAWEIHHTADHLLGAFWTTAHTAQVGR